MNERAKKFRAELRTILCDMDDGETAVEVEVEGVEFDGVTVQTVHVKEELFDRLRLAAGLSATPHPREVDAALSEIFCAD